jgi:hypothetical protein
MPCGLVKFADVSEDCIASIFKIEVMPGKQWARSKHQASQSDVMTNGQFALVSGTVWG